MTDGGPELRPLPGSPLDGETDGPVWDGPGWLVARPTANEIVRVTPDGTVSRWRHSTAGNRGLAVGPDGRCYGAQTTSRRVVWYAPTGATYLLQPMLDGRRHNDPQDLAVDANGRIWFSDDWTETSGGGPVGWPPLPHRSILRLRPTGDTDDGVGTWALERMTVDTISPRGVGLSPAGDRLYVTDLGDATTPASVRSYPVRGEGLGPASILLAFEAGGGEPGPCPGGLAVCRDGRVVVTVRDSGGGAILILAPDGTRLAATALAGEVPTNAAIGGPAGTQLVVTTTSGAILAGELEAWDRDHGGAGQ